jgi:hypothetical protein
MRSKPKSPIKAIHSAPADDRKKDSAIARLLDNGRYKNKFKELNTLG